MGPAELRIADTPPSNSIGRPAEPFTPVEADAMIGRETLAMSFGTNGITAPARGRSLLARPAESVSTVPGLNHVQMLALWMPSATCCAVGTACPVWRVMVVFAEAWIAMGKTS